MPKKLPRPKLKKGDITLNEVYYFSKKIWYKQDDNKAQRMKVDVKSGRIIAMKNYEYNPSTKNWEEISKRNIKFEFIVKTDPKSYKKTDIVKIHTFPVTFVLYDIDLGIYSPFRWRTGSFKRPVLPKAGLSKQLREQMTNTIIKRGIQLQFFFESMWVLDFWGLLYGPMTCENRPPNKTNPSFIPFFDKHALFIYEKIIVKILNKEFSAKIKNSLIK